MKLEKVMNKTGQIKDGLGCGSILRRGERLVCSSDDVETWMVKERPSSSGALASIP